jgi:hypothetical protein
MGLHNLQSSQILLKWGDAGACIAYKGNYKFIILIIKPTRREYLIDLGVDGNKTLKWEIWKERKGNKKKRNIEEPSGFIEAGVFITLWVTISCTAGMPCRSATRYAILGLVRDCQQRISSWNGNGRGVALTSAWGDWRNYENVNKGSLFLSRGLNQWPSEFDHNGRSQLFCVAVRTATTFIQRSTRFYMSAGVSDIDWSFWGFPLAKYGIIWNRP